MIKAIFSAGEFQVRTVLVLLIVIACAGCATDIKTLYHVVGTNHPQGISRLIATWPGPQSSPTPLYVHLKTIPPLTFEKAWDDTNIEIWASGMVSAKMLQGARIGDGIMFRLRVDGKEPALIDGRLPSIEGMLYNYGAGSSRNPKWTTLFAVFQGLPAGQHTVEIWANVFYQTGRAQTGEEYSVYPVDVTFQVPPPNLPDPPTLGYFGHPGGIVVKEVP